MNPWSEDKTLTVNCRSCARANEIYVSDADTFEENDATYYDTEFSFTCGYCGRYHPAGIQVSVRD